MGYAFISYSTKNQTAADAMRQLLRKNGVDTWMAPYDIPAGSEYAEVLYDALTGCACLVLLLTGDSQNSLWVKKEVNIAISNCRTVIPVKLEDMELNSAMKLYLNDQQIVPVHTLDENSEDIQKVLKSVIAMAGQSAVRCDAQAPCAAPVVEQVRQVLADGIYEGELVNGQRTGKGKFTWSNDNVYEGDFVDGHRTGKGKFTWYDGDVYEGDFVDGHRTGKGKYTWSSGSVYEGDFVDGERTGRGKYTWPNADVYEGDFVNGKKHGKGRFTDASGTYEGEYADDRKHGKGKLTWNDGDVYEGDFAGGQRTGKGKYTWHDGDVCEGDFVDGQPVKGTLHNAAGVLVGIYTDGKCQPVISEEPQAAPAAPQIRKLFSDGVYEGDFVNGQRTGKGKFTWNNGDVYEGDFVDGKRHGKGKYTWARGTVYEGDFWNGQRTGKGKLTRPGGDVYEGDFVGGKQQGMGKLTHVSKVQGEPSYVYEGPFVENQCTGKGKLTYPDGNVYEGDVVNGQRHGSGVFTWNAGAWITPKTWYCSRTPGVESGWIGGETVWDTGYVYRGTYEKDQIKNGKVYDARGVLKITYTNGLRHNED